MREGFERLLADATAVAVAIAIALGWSLYSVAEGLAHTVTILFESDASVRDIDWLTWQVGSRVLTLGRLFVGVVELGFVLLVATLVYASKGGSRAD